MVRSIKYRADKKKKTIYIYGGGSILVLIVVLMSLGSYGVEISTSDDIRCIGTYDNPCVSYFNISLKDYSICFASSFSGVSLEPKEDVVDFKIYKGTSIGDSVEWIPFDFSGKCLERNSVHMFKIEGVKKNSLKDVKWGVNYMLKSKDPYWFGQGVPPTYVNISNTAKSTNGQYINLKFDDSANFITFFSTQAYSTTTSSTFNVTFGNHGKSYAFVQLSPAATGDKYVIFGSYNSSGSKNYYINLSGTNGAVNYGRIVSMKESTSFSYFNDTVVSGTGMLYLGGFQFVAPTTGDYIIVSTIYGGSPGGTSNVVFIWKIDSSILCAVNVRFSNDIVPGVCVQNVTLSSGTHTVSLYGSTSTNVYYNARGVDVFQHDSTYHYVYNDTSASATGLPVNHTVLRIYVPSERDYIVISSGILGRYSSYTNAAAKLYIDGIQLGGTANIYSESGYYHNFGFLENVTLSSGYHDIYVQGTYSTIYNVSILAMAVEPVTPKADIQFSNGTYVKSHESNYYYLDGESYTDMSGNNSWVYAYGSVQTDNGFFGKGYAFRGSDAILLTEGIYGPSGSVSVRFYPNNTNNMVIFSKSSLTCGLFNQKINCTLSNSTHSGSVVTSYNIQPQRWYWLGYTWNTTGTYMWLDNSFIGSSLYTGGLTQNSQWFTIGSTGVSYWFNGTMDEFKLYVPAINSTNLLFDYYAINTTYNQTINVSCSEKYSRPVSLYYNQTSVSNPHTTNITNRGWNYYLCSGENFAQRYGVYVRGLTPNIDIWLNDTLNSNRSYEKNSVMYLNATIYRYGDYYNDPSNEFWVYVNSTEVCHATGGYFPITCITNMALSSSGFYIVNATEKGDSKYDRIEVIYYVKVTDMSYTFGTSETKLIRFLNCSPDWEWYPSSPENQTSVLGILNFTNTGIVSGNLKMYYYGTLNSGWTLYASNTSAGPYVQLSTTPKLIKSNINPNDLAQIWLYAKCSYVTSNPGVYINAYIE